MKKNMKIFSIMFIVILLLTLSSCRTEEENASTQRIIFQTNGGARIAEINYENELFPKEVSDPVKENYEFLGWFLDNGIYKIPLNNINKKELKGDVVLYAKWDNPRVLITMKNGDEIRMELYPDFAPTSVDNFLSLVDENYYANVVFHRVIVNFMIQTGGFYLDDKNYLQPKEHKPCIAGEFDNAGFTNSLSHTIGVVSMARGEDVNSGSTQFFICSADAPHLDGNYAAFGKVLDQSSLDVVVKLSNTQTFVVGGMQDFPLENGKELLVISSITRAE